jgi:hypothetical protein
MGIRSIQFAWAKPEGYRWLGRTGGKGRVTLPSWFGRDGGLVPLNITNMVKSCMGEKSFGIGFHGSGTAEPD